MKKLYIVRHGQSLSNVGGVAMPNAEIPLTELGQTQSKEVADWIIQKTNGHIDSIMVSEYIRTQLTAEPLISMTNIKPSCIQGLQEFNYLKFDTIKNISITKRLSIANQYWQERTPDYIDGGNSNHAESFHNFEQRVSKVLAEWADLADGTHVVYTHGLWISMLIWKILGQPVDSNESMQKFRQFELSIRARNCEVFLLTLQENQSPAITKIRTRTDNNVNPIYQLNASAIQHD